jgi:KTSC domain
MGRIPKALISGGAIVAIVYIALFKPSEIVDVKYRGPVNLKHFSCTNVERSSFIKRVCYDRSNTYMVINLNGVYYHYCEIDDGTVALLLKADSMGQYYNGAIKGRFDCRTHRVPTY